MALVLPHEHMITVKQQNSAYHRQTCDMTAFGKLDICNHRCDFNDNYG